MKKLNPFLLLALLFTFIACGDDEAQTYTVGGKVSGLNGTLIIRNNAEDPLTIKTNKEFTFTNTFKHGDAYEVVVYGKPAGQTCTVTKGEGIIEDANITNVRVTCTNN